MVRSYFLTIRLDHHFRHRTSLPFPKAFSKITNQTLSFNFQRTKVNSATLSILTFSRRLRCAGSPSPSISMNRNNESGSRYQKSTLIVGLLNFPRVPLFLLHDDVTLCARCRTAAGSRWSIVRTWCSTWIQNTFQLWYDISVRFVTGSSFIVIIEVSWWYGWCFGCRSAGPIDPAFAPASLIKQLHSATSSSVRVQQQFRIFQNRSSWVTSDLHIFHFKFQCRSLSPLNPVLTFTTLLRMIFQLAPSQYSHQCVISYHCAIERFAPTSSGKNFWNVNGNSIWIQPFLLTFTGTFGTTDYGTLIDRRMTDLHLIMVP